MPARTIPLITDEIYHVLNRGHNSVPIFNNKYNFQKFVQTFLYYQNTNPPLRFSQFNNLPNSERSQLTGETKNKQDFLVEIIAYCLMPNHYHFILKQRKEKGIVNFIRRFTNSYSRYFNTKYKRKGALFGGRFQAIRIETEEQLLHLSRYIHLNPYSSYLVKNFQALLEYPFSSLPEYIGSLKENPCQKQIILDHFGNSGSYKNFVINQADYQKTLEHIKHQTLEYTEVHT